MIAALASLIARLATFLLPPPLRDWGRGMEIEAAAIEPPVAALGFALGCLGCAFREAIVFHLLSPAAEATNPINKEPLPMSTWSHVVARPRHLATLCAAGATGLGLAYMAAAGAPLRYLAVNGGALAMGCLALAALTGTFRISDAARGAVVLALAGALLLTSLLGVSADGATRWVSAAGIPLQPSLLLVPVLALSFARGRDGLSTFALLIAAAALALAPDRAMAGALAAGMAALALLRPKRNALIALGAALAAFAVTLLRPDRSAAMPYVDQIFYSSFAVHPLAGIAVLAGAALLLVPAGVGLVRDVEHRAAYAVFGAVWLAVILAAALGNYPTPLVGYSGSAIIGYMLSLIGLPSRAATQGVAPYASAPTQDARDEHRRPRIGLSYSA